MIHMYWVFIIFVLLLPVRVGAVSVGFGENHTYWPGWNNGSRDDRRDVIGNPGFTGGSAEMESRGQLKELTFTRKKESSPYWWALSPGDLFIDVGNESMGPSVSEPGYLLLLGCGLVGIVGLGRKKLIRKK